MKFVARTMLSILVILLAMAADVAAEQPDFDTTVLRSIDTVPTRAQLDETWPDARARLMKAATDTDRNVYERHRAITLLSLYPDSKTRSALTELAASESAEIRKMAVYTAARTFGTPGDANLVSFVRRFVRDDNPEVREWAVRGLRWVDHAQAREVLESVLAADDAALKPVARRALKKWVGERETPVR